MTASISMLPEITAKVGPPRVLEVPYRLGYPLGAAGDAVLQTAILRRLLATCGRTDVPFIERLPGPT
ncbi:MAG: hypothetical protein NT062_09620 [Proteobacteria bacterium]|nr:hypothetical protein [Pseudomonadota bacterium]